MNSCNGARRDRDAVYGLRPKIFYRAGSVKQ